MPLQNRVGPTGELVVDPGRGLVFGNRGCLHDEHGRIRRAFAGKRWIACRLEFKSRHRRPLLQPGRYTELFFLDEATALAAGHRPCAECRRDDYRRFVLRWNELHPGEDGADAIDERLHAERLVPGSSARRLHDASFAELPDGAYVLDSSAAWLVKADQLLLWTAGGYLGRRPRPPRGRTLALTPPSLLALLTEGWHPTMPLLHPSAI